MAVKITKKEHVLEVINKMRSMGGYIDPLDSMIWWTDPNYLWDKANEKDSSLILYMKPNSKDIKYSYDENEFKVLVSSDVFLGKNKPMEISSKTIEKIRNTIGNYPLKVHYYEDYIEILLYESEDRILIEENKVYYMGITHDVSENKIPLDVMREILNVMEIVDREVLK